MGCTLRTARRSMRLTLTELASVFLAGPATSRGFNGPGNLRATRPRHSGAADAAVRGRRAALLLSLRPDGLPRGHLSRTLLGHHRPAGNSRPPPPVTAAPSAPSPP